MIIIIPHALGITITANVAFGDIGQNVILVVLSWDKRTVSFFILWLVLGKPTLVEEHFWGR